MIVRKGTHKCERCGKTYDWIARKLEKGEIVVGRAEDTHSHNIQFFGYIQGRLVATGYCPYCKSISMTRLVDDEV